MLQPEPTEGRETASGCLFNHDKSIVHNDILLGIHHIIPSTVDGKKNGVPGRGTLPT